MRKLELQVFLVAASFRLAFGQTVTQTLSAATSYTPTNTWVIPGNPSTIANCSAGSNQGLEASKLCI